MNDFKTDYLSHWQEPSDDKKRLALMAKTYHELTEHYDRTVCTGPIIDGSIRPANAREIGLINVNARLVDKECFLQASWLGFTRQQWDKAIQDAAPH